MVRCLLLWLCVPNVAWAWPTDAEWLPLTRDGEALTDPSELASSFDYVDLYGDETGSTLWWYADAQSLRFRIQVTDDPLNVDQLSLGTWGVLVELDSEPADFEFALTATGPTGLLQGYQNAAHDDGPAPLFTAYELVGSDYGDLDDGSIRVVRVGARYFLDFSISRAALLTDFSVIATDELRVTPFTASAAGASPRVDLALCDNSGNCSDLEPLLSDVVVIDADQDGLTLPEETAVGSDPNDTDSDNDGFPDANESLLDVDNDGIIGLLDCDSDGDGLMDGTEAGVSERGEDTAKGACFVPDSDPTTTTNPNGADTDGGGLADGLEDWNHNGKIDPWETDPNNPLDDEDTDGDGIPDVLEDGHDPDGDNIDADDDLDSDGDGIPDAEEGADDTDGDGTPDFLDTDADGDGISDADEGTEDLDGDGSGNWVDDDDDGDGTDTIDEGTGDVDCDGIPNYLDPNDEDGDCDTDDTPGVDTDFDPDTDDVPFAGNGHLTGGACSTVPTGSGGFWALTALGLVLWRRRRGAVIAGLAVSGSAAAQEVDAERFSPAPDNFALYNVRDARDGYAGQQRYHGASVYLDYADDPLVWRGSGEPIDVLGGVSTLSIGGFQRLTPGLFVGGTVPVHLYRRAYVPGDGLEPLDEQVDNLGPGLGDIRLSARQVIPLAGPVAVAPYVEVALPTGAKRGYVASGSLQGTVGVAGSVAFRDTGTVAVDISGRSGTGEDLGAVEVGPSLGWGVGISDEVIHRVRLGLEADGEYWLNNDGEPGRVPIEWLAHAKYRVAGDFWANLAGGNGLTRGIGAPDFRVVAGFQWAPGTWAKPVTVPVMPIETVPVVTVPVATTGTLLIHAVGPSGVPVPGAQVTLSGQPHAIEKRDGYKTELSAGKYELVISAPGWLPVQRKIDVEAGAILDMTVFMEPERVVVDTESKQIFLTSKVFFELDKAELKVESLVVLDALVKVLGEHPELTKIRIEGHTDSRGTDEYNLELSRERAKAVVDYLVKQGVNRARLTSIGLGESRLLQQGDSEDVHATNRRVEFHIEAMEPTAAPQ